MKAINYIGLTTAQILFQKMAVEQLDKTKWNSNYIRISKFKQDIYGYTDKDNPENNIEPTFNWYCTLASQRLSDGEFFYVNILAMKEEIIEGKIDEALAIEDFKNAIEALEDFAENCACKAGKPSCEKHYYIT